MFGITFKKSEFILPLPTIEIDITPAASAYRAISREACMMAMTVQLYALYGRYGLSWTDAAAHAEAWAREADRREQFSLENAFNARSNVELMLSTWEVMDQAFETVWGRPSSVSEEAWESMPAVWRTFMEKAMSNA